VVALSHLNPSERFLSAKNDTTEESNTVAALKALFGAKRELALVA